MMEKVMEEKLEKSLEKSFMACGENQAFFPVCLSELRCGQNMNWQIIKATDNYQITLTALYVYSGKQNKYI